MRGARVNACRLLGALSVAALIAVGCSGESDSNGTSADTGTDTADTTADTAGDPGDTTDTAETGEPTDTGGGSGEIWDDPRGGIFADFQAQFDRSHPFQSLDTFCLPHEEATDRQATEPGIDVDSIQVHQIRQQLENLIDIGFGSRCRRPDPHVRHADRRDQ